MRYRIKLIPKSPFLIGGKKLNSDYIKSLNYIPGGVLRAALSQEIASVCAYYNEEEVERKNWIEYRNLEECSKCPYKSICKNFSNIIISNSYPLGANIYPLTTMGCKDESEHEPFDTLIDQLKLKIALLNNNKYSPDYSCSSKGCNSRTERHSGLYIYDNGKLKDIDSVYEIMTKNSINSYTRNARDGILYTLDCHSTYVFKGKEQEKAYFEGYIYSNEEIVEDLKNLNDLYVGAYNTSGLGHMEFEYLKNDKEDSKENISNRIKEFNELIGDENNYYIPITLLSDCYCNIEDYYDKPLYDIKTEEYIDMFNKKLNIGDIYYSVLSIDMVRGFDTSKKVSVQRKLKKVIKAGSILVIKTNTIDYERLLDIEKNGIGSNTAHGFGQVSVCDRFHIDKYKNKGEK